jgi:large subunit ribosomal protein L35
VAADQSSFPSTLESTSTIPVGGGLWSFRAGRLQESKMPKMKTKSGAKKRFKITGTGKVMSAQAGKRHGMIKRTKKTIREHRGMNVRSKGDADNIKKYWMPNG